MEFTLALYQNDKSTRQGSCKREYVARRRYVACRLRPHNEGVTLIDDSTLNEYITIFAFVSFDSNSARLRYDTIDCSEDAIALYYMCKYLCLTDCETLSW